MSTVPTKHEPGFEVPDSARLLDLVNEMKNCDSEPSLLYEMDQRTSTFRDHGHRRFTGI